MAQRTHGIQSNRKEGRLPMRYTASKLWCAKLATVASVQMESSTSNESPEYLQTRCPRLADGVAGKIAGIGAIKKSPAMPKEIPAGTRMATEELAALHWYALGSQQKTVTLAIHETADLR